MDCPIAIIHKGSPDYLKWSLLQVKLFNSDITLIGDLSNKYHEKTVKYTLIDNLKSEDAKRFKGIYQHFSANNYNFEVFCFERWFILLEYMKQNNLERIVHLDSDVMVYMNLNKLVIDELTKYQASYHVPNQEYSGMRWIAVPHISFWTRAALQSFCDFIINQYTSGIEELKSKWEWHKISKVGGGICDMTLLYLYYIKNTERIGNLAPTNEVDGFVFDLNINSGENYFQDEFKTKYAPLFKKLKRIKFIGGIPHGYNLKLNKNVTFGNLHCQGKSKLLMYFFFSGRKTLVDLYNYLIFAFPFLWKRYLQMLRSKSVH